MPTAIWTSPKPTVIQRVTESAAAGESGSRRPAASRSGSQKSWIIDEAEAFSELAIVDIAAARIAASKSPMSPVFAGKCRTMKVAKTSSGRVGGASPPSPWKAASKTPMPRKSANWRNTTTPLVSRARAASRWPRALK